MPRRNLPWQTSLTERWNDVPRGTMDEVRSHASLVRESRSVTDGCVTVRINDRGPVPTAMYSMSRSHRRAIQTLAVSLCAIHMSSFESLVRIDPINVRFSNRPLMGWTRRAPAPPSRKGGTGLPTAGASHATQDHQP